mmetsp:Transcript_19755/g.32458  ORF Transcript_19755/g.32458 Transcript_19755/m.32458 type:complete len:368 (-) Transcript_19755:57-1160(-)|eukprot:CAMPEP_0203749116 /NCGR_PEP_ID=MMETSP0098-20131031/3792_1 /ASSEMBLY_ACC=CAM_ASM_000208 /TAXON_ID=96639 /ORGANISM=" , Strain NY0313808BC1" /LENGTH=367 /DNA_ID=CAMNT_0050638079 /DNA_START=455 /DNA_END=1555 /DNA_ORIENTATION=+
MDEFKSNVLSLYASHGPRVWAELERCKVFFQNDAVMQSSTFEPSGDWYGDMFVAWKQAWAKGAINKFNDTHFDFVDMAYLDGKTTSCQFKSTWQLVPELEPLYLDHQEDYFNGAPLSEYMRVYYYIPIIAVTLYMLVIFGGNLIMRAFPAMSLKWPLALWNLSLSLFSFAGVVRTVPHLLATIDQYGLYTSVCGRVCNTYGGGAVGLWSFLFIISKFPELVDTVFIVLRKRPLIFLHWYHHVTVLLYCWQSYATQASAGIYFIAMNYSVHAIMYGYYFLKAVGLWPRFIPPWIITICQLSQMVVGIAVCLLTYKYQEMDKVPCSTSAMSFKTGVAMYFSYFLLFLQILFTLLSGPGPKKVSKGKKTN